MKKIMLCIWAGFYLLGLMACKEDVIAPLQKVEVIVGEAFIVKGLTELSFPNFDAGDYHIEVRNFTEHYVKGLVSARTYVDVDIIDNKRVNYLVEAGYEDRCHGQSTGGLCNELRFELKGQSLILKFEEVYWSDIKENKEGVEFMEVDSAKLIVETE